MAWRERKPTSIFTPSFSRWLLSDFAGVLLLAAAAAAAAAAAGAAAPPSSADAGADAFATSLLRGGMAGVRGIGWDARIGMLFVYSADIGRTMLCGMEWSRGAA